MLVFNLKKASPLLQFMLTYYSISAMPKDSWDMARNVYFTGIPEHHKTSVYKGQCFRAIYLVRSTEGVNFTWFTVPLSFAIDRTLWRLSVSPPSNL